MTYNEREQLGIDTDTKRLIELTSLSEKSQDAIGEIISLVQRKAPKLFDGLTSSNKEKIAALCQLKLYSHDEVVCLQGDDPDAYYTVIRGAVSIYVLNSTLYDHERGNGREKYGKFITQLNVGEAFGELSFNISGDHDRRNASVVSDGHDASGGSCVLLLVPESCYLSEMIGRDSSKHQTKDKIQLLKSSLLFRHWTMDKLVKLAYMMKKKYFEKGATIVPQGERMEHFFIINNGKVRIVIKGVRNGRKKEQAAVTVDIADLRQRDVIGLIEVFNSSSSSSKSPREAVALTETEVFYVPLTFIKPMLLTDKGTCTIAEQVVERRRNWTELRTDYAAKFPQMSMKLPKGAATVSVILECLLQNALTGFDDDQSIIYGYCMSVVEVRDERLWPATGLCATAIR